MTRNAIFFFKAWEFTIELNDGKDPVDFLNRWDWNFTDSKDDSLLRCVMSFILKWNTLCGFIWGFMLMQKGNEPILGWNTHVVPSCCSAILIPSSLVSPSCFYHPFTPICLHHLSENWVKEIECTQRAACEWTTDYHHCVDDVLGSDLPGFELMKESSSWHFHACKKCLVLCKPF